jgi:hypothetical protein
MTEGTERLTFKWGTLKTWNLKTEKSQGVMKEYIALGASMSAMAQRDTPEQKKLLCDLIDAVDGPIHNDWSGYTMSKEEAKIYVMEYIS